MKLAAAGVGVGLLAALWLARYVATMLFGRSAVRRGELQRR
jgi:hypothetical protein